jgi:Zn-dependent protease with chaperone function
VTVAAALAAYAVCAGVLGPHLLGRADWAERAPRLGILTYLAAAWSVVAACGLAGLTLTVHATALGGGLSRLIGACVLRLRAEYATPGGGAVAWSGLALAAAVAAWTVVTAVTHLRAVRGQAVRTAQAVRLVGQPEPELGAVLVEHLQPAVYCVAGPHPTVVMTTGALQALDPGQVDAVLAHERAHLACHHHRLLAIARIGRQVFPFIPLMRDAAGQVARLAEMHADDAATAGRDTRPLATALVVLALAAVGPVPETPALAAAGPDAVARIQRLLAPAEPLGRVRRHLLRAAAAGLALIPLLLALTPAVVALALGRVQPA